MKAFKTLSILLFLTVAVNLFGQSTETEKPYIEVVGTAEREIIPNEIYITINIQERIEKKEKVSIEKQEEELKAAMKSIDIPLENLSLSFANSHYVDISWSKRDIITKVEYILKVDDALSLGRVFEKLNQIKIVDARISKIDHSEIETLQKEIRIEAIKSAKDKADYLLNAIGEETGKPQIIREEHVGSYSINHQGYPNKYPANHVNAQPIKGSNRIVEHKKMILSSSIYVKFNIK